ncbi:aspartic peptidase domain-containing protein [Sordaria brevicollis]|uniref:Aspartic peptidase domain-containing protein n=1 Tax=Sordaria brevicollis TaxID=83679 RepID=A0AAE0UDE6_SORBR|nr:aspartic peptidase domain-containing protein [Sordaria brevicollis]
MRLPYLHLAADFLFLSSVPSLVRAATTETVPLEPLWVQPSGEWYGIDGTWSNFMFAVGSPAQIVYLTPATALSETWVVGAGGCTSGPGNQPCVDARGGVFDHHVSETWHTLGAGAYELGMNHIGVQRNGDYGLDTVAFVDTMASSATSIDNVLIAAVNATEYYQGYIGLGVTQGSIDHNATYPLITQLAEVDGMIPSHSYGYTAGAYYRDTTTNGTHASLTLGGYDTLRFVPHDTTFRLYIANSNADPNDRAPTVRLRGLSAQVPSLDKAPGNWTSPSQTFVAMNDSITAMIDSSTPFLWLPTEICERIASALDLVWREDLGVYVFANGGDQYLKYKHMKTTEELSFTFTVSSYDNSDDFGYPLNMPGVVNITLPPAAFAQVLRYPWKNVIKFNESSIPYFPLTRSTKETNNNLYIIGRVFMQEAYIITKYDKASFSIHQALFPDNSATNHSLQVIERPPNSPYPEGPPMKKSHKKPLGVGQTVAIVVSAFAAGSVIGLICFFCCRRKSKAKKDHVRKQLDHGGEEVTPVHDQEPTQSPVSRMLSMFVGRRRSRRQSAATQETEKTISGPVEVGADAQHQVFELPVPPEPVELDNNDIGNNDDANLGLEGSRQHMSEYEAARRKLERQLQGPVPTYTPTTAEHNVAGYPNEKSAHQHEVIPVVHYRPSEEPSPGSSPTYANTDSLPNSLPSPLSPTNADWAAGRVFDLPSPMTVASPIRLQHFPTTAHSPISLQHSPTHSPHPYLPSPVSPSSDSNGNGNGNGGAGSGPPTSPTAGGQQQLPLLPPSSPAPIQRTPIDPMHTQIVCLGPMPENVRLPVPSSVVPPPHHHPSHHHRPTVPRIITPDGRLHPAAEQQATGYVDASEVNVADLEGPPQTRRSDSVTRGSNETLGSNFTIMEEAERSRFRHHVQLAAQGLRSSAVAQHQHVRQASSPVAVSPTSPISPTSPTSLRQQPQPQRRRGQREGQPENETNSPREEDFPRSPRSMERIEAGSELVHVPQVAAQRYSWEAETR